MSRLDPPLGAPSRARLVLAAAMALAILGLVGCDDGVHLIIDLRTDFQPGVEFSQVRTEVIRPASTPGGIETRRMADSSASAGDDFLAGQRIGEFALMAPGDVIIRTTLLDDTGRTVIVRDTRVHVTSNLGLTVLLTRSCRGVICPGEDLNATGVCRSPSRAPAAAASSATSRSGA